MNAWTRMRIVVLTIGCLALGLAFPVQAGTITWTGGGDGSGTNWNDAANWGGAKPGTNDTAAFDTPGCSDGKVIALGAPQTIRRFSIPAWRGNTMSFGNAADLAAGNTLTLSEVFRGAYAANKNQTFAANIVLSADSTWDLDNGYGGGIVVNGAIGGTGRGLAKWGTGTLTLNGANTYTGDTTVNVGTLALGFNASGAPTSNSINSASALKMAGGTLTLNGKTTVRNNSQTVNGLTLNPSASSITIAAGATTNYTFLSLGAITHNSGGTLNFSQPTVNTTISATNGYATTTTNDASGILGAYLTVAGTDWAANNGTNIVAYTGYTTLAGNTPSIIDGATSNVRISNASTGDVGQAAGTVTINTLLAKDTASRNVTIGSGNTLRLGATGGILVPNGTGVLNIGAPGNAGTLTAGGADNTAGEIICCNSTTVTNNAVIADNGSGPITLTKSFGGTLILTATNTHTGGTFVNGGTLILPSGTNCLATSSALTVAGGTLNLGGSRQTNTSSVVFYSGTTTNGTIVKSGSNYSAQGGTVYANLGGSVGLDKTTPGTLYLAGANTYTGRAYAFGFCGRRVGKEVAGRIPA